MCIWGLTYFRLSIIMITETRDKDLPKGENKMFTVYTYDEMAMDDVVVFEGTLAECVAYVDGDEELYIVEPDGFTVWEA